MDNNNPQRSMGMSSPLESMLEKNVQIVTSDGRVFVGYLRGLDQALNMIVGDCEERVYSKENGIRVEKMGLFMIRGDNVAMLGELDEDIEMNLDLNAIKADQLKPFVN